ncbi:hypothetical protein DV736_g569, partial [Chaetothyriales sp. CBS 134916]
MAQKRKREEEPATSSASVKLQKPEKPVVDPRLVQIYDQLADEKEFKRLKAATQLLQKLQNESTTQEDVERALRRLFRGLCSARKAARQGFSVTLTELLAQLAAKTIKAPLASEQLITLLETATAPDSSATKQEDRDHLLGLVFAADAVIKSGILTQRRDRAQWKRLVAIVCAVSQKKTWLRQETGWMLYQFAETAAADTATPDIQFFLDDIIDALSTHRLIRTSEGVAIWLSAKKSFPDAKLSKHVWKQGHPLAAKDVNTLADIMKDARGGSSEEHAMEAQGAALWSANLHFAWEVVLSLLLDPTAMKTKDLVSFANFWTVVVDQGLFATSSSPERKQTGLSVLISATQTVPLDFLPQLCSKNVVHSLVRGLGDKDTYLHKVCEKAKKAIEDRLVSFPDMKETSTIPAACLDAVFRATETQDLDTLTKSKFLFRTGLDGNASQRISIINTFNKMATEVLPDKKRYRWILDFQAKSLIVLLRDSVAKMSEDDVQQVIKPLSSWFNLVYGSHDDLSDDFKAFVKSRIENVLEQCLRGGGPGWLIFTSCVENGIMLPIREGQIKSNKEIRQILDAVWRKVCQFTKDAGSTGVGQALSLLYCTIIMDIASGEPDSIESYHELIEMDDLQGNADAITEVLLGLAPRPSKFLRLVSLQVFESISPYLTQDGLDALTRVLLTKENDSGQQEMFGSAEDEDGEGNFGSESDELDSDVEVVDGPDVESSDSDADLAQGEQEAESSDSDVDMDDDQMTTLDEKLAEVFRARKEANSKKKERKDTKEAFIHFKNRVLDLVEVYFKHECRNGLAATLVLPILQSVRITKNKQIADRTCNILRQFFAKCKGKDVPKVSKQDAPNLLSQFRQVHEEACQESSNAHASLASTASILLVKVLLGAGTDVNVLVSEYGETRKRQLTNKSCKVQPSFFSDWNNWCAQARAQLAK